MCEMLGQSSARYRKHEEVTATIKNRPHTLIRADTIRVNKARRSKTNETRFLVLRPFSSRTLTRLRLQRAQQVLSTHDSEERLATEHQAGVVHEHPLDRDTDNLATSIVTTTRLHIKRARARANTNKRDGDERKYEMNGDLLLTPVAILRDVKNMGDCLAQ